MGQYYNPSILKTNYKLANNPVKVALRAWDFRNGRKLMEHSWVGNNLVDAFIHLIGENSPYYGQPCVWAGDYADDFTSRMVKEKGHTIYNFADDIIDKLPQIDSITNVQQMNKRFNKLFGKDIFSPSSYKNWAGEDVPFLDCSNSLDTYKYIVNLHTKEYIEIPEPNYEDWIVHPLPLLLADGNGRGGGDYRGEDINMVGKWAYHPIGATNEIPEGFTLLVTKFAEE